MPALDARAVRLIRQHAHTSRLLGVDFVPLGNGFEFVPGEPAHPEPEPAPASTGGPSEPCAQVETKPAKAPPGKTQPRPGAYTPIALPDKKPSQQAAQALLDEIRDRYEADAPHQHFETDHHSIVFGEGDPCARLMFVGEAPGEQEDREGRPFVGRSGVLLEKMIVAMGLSRESVYICNVLKTRPPNNQTPTVEEAALCAPYLFDQIRVVRPEVIVTLGLPASRLLLGTSEPMRSMRGSFREFPSGSGTGIFGGFELAWTGDPIPVMPTYHPAYLLRSYTPENRKKVWSDLQKVMDRLGSGVS
ncbi:MAG: uracil-DNA glycosylase [Phycisphaerales bacterium JB040]